MRLPITDGLLAVVKDDCETCHLVIPVLAELARREQSVAVVCQDRAAFPPGFEVIHDRELDISWRLGTETTPTIYRIENGEVVDQQAGWLRIGWERVAAARGLGAGLPGQRPGCGSDTMLPRRPSAAPAPALSLPPVIPEGGSWETPKTPSKLPSPADGRMGCR